MFLARVPMLKVDGEGTIIAENDAARELLGPSVGRLCCEAVAAEEDGILRCNAGCVSRLLRDGTSQEVDEADVRDTAVRLACSALGDDVVVAVVPSRVEVPAHPLTPREKDVVDLIAQGFTNARIAKRLGISASTVRTHVERLLDKLGASSRAEAVTRAVATGQLHLS